MSKELKALDKIEERLFGGFNGQDHFEEINLIRTKLEQVDKLEKRLGIDLNVLFKAIKNGVWVKDEYTNEVELRYFSHFSFDDLIVPDTPYMDGIELKDYGKKWSLNKKDLEVKS